MKMMIIILAVYLLSGSAAAFAEYSDIADSSLSTGTSITVQSTVRGEVVSVDKTDRKLSLQDMETGSTHEYTASSAEALGSIHEGDSVILLLGADGTIQNVKPQ